jgi:paraquat-inducible protein A
LLRLFEAKHYVLFLLVGTFSLAVPLVKLGLLALACNYPSWTTAQSPRLLHWLALCGKWSMLDVFLVAILITVGTFRGIVAVEVQYGVYAFAAAMLLLHLVTCRLETLMRQRACGNGLVEDAPAISEQQEIRKRS